jgi:DNA adenine methylase
MVSRNPKQLTLFEMDYAVPSKIYNVASVPQRSIFRYPGGKTWFVPYLRKWFTTFPARPTTLIEPFAGGGIIGLTAAFENLVDRVVLIERDPQIAAVWNTILSADALWLAAKIVDFDLNAGHVETALTAVPASTRELAFQTILRNRVNRGGILAAGAGRIKNGENGKGLASRWYPQTLAKRIRDIASLQDRIQFIEGDGLSIIRQYSDAADAVFFIDPPYTAGGKRAGSRLYTYSEIDHPTLFCAADSLSGHFLMTYDDADDVRAFAQSHQFETRTIQMKNTHHAEMTELVISRHLDWLA